VPSPDTPPDHFGAFLSDYFAECDEHLTAVRQLLLAVEHGKRGLPASGVEDLFRSFHSIKGLSGMVELRDAELLAHHMESYLRALRDQGGSVSPEAVSALMEGTNALEQVIAARRAGQPAPAIDTIVRLLEALPGTTPAQVAGGAERWRVVFTPSQQLAARGIGVDRVRALLRDVGDIIEAVPRVSADGSVRFEFIVEGTVDDPESPEWADQGVMVERVATAAAERPADPIESAVSSVSPGIPGLLAPSHYVRVDLARLDDLMRMIGDLVISRARLAETLSRIEAKVPPGDWRAIQENSLAIERQLRDLREGVMRVRLVPVGEIFRRMPFVVRDLARETGKNVTLAMQGQDTEIDKFLIERMLDPVLHLVRNAVSHGIESPEERAAAGKPRTATITLSAASVGDLVVIEVTDDGRGIDREAVAERAREAGLMMPDGPLDNDTLLQILCAPGFSTRDSADRASGRGVGMAVVQTTVTELGGSVSLDSEEGQGTRFLIELPLTLAITDAIIARVGTQTFALAQAAVREVIEVMPGAVRSIENNDIIPHRGGVLPIVRLSEVFQMESQPGRALHVFVVGQGLSAVGLVVDRIIGQREIVVRTFADALVKVDGVVGATDLGDGRVVLILDAQRLAAAHRDRGVRSGV
jgi:two-component system, chemotaxis family, sensor kinase CheA